MSTKKKEFLKKYASSMKNVTNQGVWSARGIGIPVAGAIFGGDDYKEKIGKNRTPWYLTKGRPSMPADAGWSSLSMSRVNKGEDRDLYDSQHREMFPNQSMQEEDDLDTYVSKSQERKKMSYFNENKIVVDSKYSLLNISKDLSEQIDFERLEIDDFIPDRLEPFVDSAIETGGEYISDIVDRAREIGEPAYNLLAQKVEDLTGSSVEPSAIKDVALEVGRDFLALTAAGIPVIGTPIAAGYVLYNIGELQGDNDRMRREFDELLVNGTEEDIESLQRATAETFDDYIDLLQATVYLIPFVGAARGIVAAAGRLLTKAKAPAVSSAVGLSGAGSSVLKSAIKSEILLSPVFKFAVSLEDTEVTDVFDIDKTYYFNVLWGSVRNLVVAAELIDDALLQLEEFKSTSPQGEFKYDPSKSKIDGLEVSEARSRLASGNYDSIVSDLLDRVESDIRDGLETEMSNIFPDTSAVSSLMEKKMNINRKLLSDLIKEVMLSEAPYAQPEGWSFREPQMGEGYEDSSDSEYNLDNLVNVKTDSGYMRYQSRPKNLEEQALRRIIRRKLSEGKEQDSKSESSDNSDDVDEQSVVANIAGVSTPLGTGPKYPKKD